MKKNRILAIGSSFLIFWGCADKNQQNNPLLKSEYDLTQASGGIIPCNFSISFATEFFPREKREQNITGDSILLPAKTAKVGYSAFSITKYQRKPYSNTPNIICDQLEKEFSGYGNSQYREHSYLEMYSKQKIKNTAQSLFSNEYGTLKPENSYLVLQYQEPSINKAITKMIPIDAHCKDDTKINYTPSIGLYRFRHANNCQFKALAKRYSLDSGEEISLSFNGSIFIIADGRLKLIINDISWK